jgi:hypothetical protein
LFVKCFLKKRGSKAKAEIFFGTFQHEKKRIPAKVVKVMEIEKH